MTVSVEDASGRPGAVKNALLRNFTLAPSGAKDPVVSEVALVSSVTGVTSPYAHTRLLLQSSLRYCYDRDTTTVNANVGLATHGQSVSEVLGSGNAATPNQSFTLKQSPLDLRPVADADGPAEHSRGQGHQVTWTEVPTLFQQGPSAQVYATVNQPDGSTRILFGDGVEGAMLPTGQNNIHANYRIGSGAPGNVAAAALTTLMDRPLGVNGVTTRRRPPADRMPVGRSMICVQCAAVRPDAGTRGLDHRLPELRAPPSRESPKPTRSGFRAVRGRSVFLTVAGRTAPRCRRATRRSRTWPRRCTTSAIR